MLDLKDENQAQHLARFFKTGPGEYGEGDRFLGIKVPVTRKIVKDNVADADVEGVKVLVSSPWHEIRLAGFLTLVDLYSKAVKKHDNLRAKEITETYLRLANNCNNWDLVDLSAPYILGNAALSDSHYMEVISNLSNDERLWYRRIGVVATLMLSRKGLHQFIYKIAPIQFGYNHDLIHKATGWMLRESGKRDEEMLKTFLKDNEIKMPRTMYRYAREIIARKEKAGEH